MRNRFTGTPPAGIRVSGPGKLTFNSVRFPRRSAYGLPISGAWAAVNGAHLTFNHSMVVAPLGVNDATSKVTINP